MDVELISIDNALECSIVQRTNRFVVEVRVEGKTHAAWINNTGRLRDWIVAGRAGFCVRRHGEGKTLYRLFAIREGTFAALIDTQWQMRALESCLARGHLPWLGGPCAFRRNQRLGESVVDYWLECDAGSAYLEVKSAVLRQGQYGMYPDCPSARGRRQVRALTSYAEQGGRAYVVFIAALPGVAAFRPNQAGDAQLPALLSTAREAGVEVRAVAMYYRIQSASVVLYDADLRVDLP
jgi:sugar fermentation stimulation protein A